MTKFKKGDLVTQLSNQNFTYEVIDVECEDSYTLKIIENKINHSSVGDIYKRVTKNNLKLVSRKPVIEVGSKWESCDDLVTVVHVSEGICSSVFYEFNDGSGTAEYFHNFIEDWKPYLEKKSLTQYIMVLKDKNTKEISFEGFYASKEEAEHYKIYLQENDLIEIVEFSYQEK